MRKLSGQTLIGVLIGLAILAILAQALFTVTNISYQLVSSNRARIAARHLAQNQMELIRNLPYDLIGTAGGIPSGNIEQTENVKVNGLNYVITTSIIYVDDIFDGTSPTDLLPTDYKRIRVDISWEGLTSSTKAPVVLVTDISPQGIETTAGGGTLSILVFDANALPVSQADVTIRATGTNPTINLSLQTNNNGIIILPGAPICTTCYDITVTKSGFSTDRTYTNTEVANPNKPPASVIDGGITEISFAIDMLSNLIVNTLDTRENNFSPVASIPFTFQGAKTIGTDINDFPVYKYSKGNTTNLSGTVTINDLEWDSYSLTIATDSAITGSNPLLPLLLLPNSNAMIDVSLASGEVDSLLTIITDGASPIASASVELSDLPAYLESGFTGNVGDPDYGQIFFSGLSVNSYSITATASGFIDYNDSVNVSGNTIETIIMNP